MGTARTYAGRVALYLTWASTVDVVEEDRASSSWPASPAGSSAPPPASTAPARAAPLPGPDGRCARPGPFAGHRGRDPRRGGGLRRLRRVAGRTEPAVAEVLSSRTELRFLPPGFDRGERRGRPVITRRRVRRRRVEKAPMTLSKQQVGALVDACGNARDRFVVEALYATACGWPSCAGCTCRICTCCPRPCISAARWPGRTCTCCAGRTTRTERWPSRSTRGSFR